MTPADASRAVMRAIRQGRHASQIGVAEAAGLDLDTTCETINRGMAAKRLAYRDEGPGFRWFEVVE